MTNQAPTTQANSEVPFDPVRFGIEVQDLATTIEATPGGEDLTKQQMRAAGNIANIFSNHRKELIDEFTGPQASSARELLGIDVRAKPDLTLPFEERAVQERAKREFVDVDAEFDHLEATRRAIGEWLLTLPPNKRRPIDADAVIDAMFAYDLKRIAFKDADYEMAEGVIEQQKGAAEQQRSLEQKLSSSWSTQYAATLIMSVFRDNPIQAISKLGIKGSKQFGEAVKSQFAGISKEQFNDLFDYGWSYIEAFFKDVDAHYELFEVSSRTKGTKYKLKDSDLALELWDIEHDSSVEEVAADPVEQQIAKKMRVTKFDSTGLAFEDGSTKDYGSVAKMLYERLNNTKPNEWISRGLLAQEIADTTKRKKDDIERELKEIVALLGPGMVQSAYSRRGNRVLIAGGKGFVRAPKKQ